ncbi:MAG TPA: alcohol dehydrogenase catalytic domain-containing protein [Steroidobacteraceae bacterium]|nr:alcohol dehydrogenase catalytic domain-containing protein [Steroidobacteraceae bacterium]
MKTMKAARLHKVGEEMRLETVPIPKPNVHDVLVRVRACGIVPNLANILTHWQTWFPELPLPPTPAIFGLDPAGEIVEVGSHVHAWKPGDRVYVNPGRYCLGCRPCRNGDFINCTSYTFNGYFGFAPGSLKIFEQYPHGGLCEYLAAPQYALVKLPVNVTFEQGARFGYLGTMYSALRKGRVAPGRTLLVNGISGTLGIGGALFGLAMGATKIYGTGRNPALLERVRALAPDRIEVLSIEGQEPTDHWVKRHTGGAGVDVFVDALGPGADHETFRQGVRSLKRGGRGFNIGAIAGTVGLDLHPMMDNQQAMEGSLWFTAGEGQDMADMVESGLVDLSVFEHVCCPLEAVNDAIGGIAERNGGFSNFVIQP